MISCYSFTHGTVETRRFSECPTHYNDVMMSAIASQIIGVSIGCPTACSGVYQRKYQRSVSLTLVRRIHRWPVDFPHKGPVTRKMFPFDDAIMPSMTTNPGADYADRCGKKRISGTSILIAFHRLVNKCLLQERNAFMFLCTKSEIKTDSLKRNHCLFSPPTNSTNLNVQPLTGNNHPHECYYWYSWAALSGFNKKPIK